MGIKNGQELGTLLVTADLVGAVVLSGAFEFVGTANIEVKGAGTGSVILERSFNAGVDWTPLTNLAVTTTFTGPGSEVIFNREPGVLYRFKRTVVTAGTMTVRASQ